jgi:hypothetical protein
MKSRSNLQLQQAEATLNPWLFSYIRQHQNQQTRFEIDRYLLNEGANPVEIEAVWQYLAASSVNQKKPGIIKRWSNSKFARFTVKIFQPIKQILLTPGLGWFIYSLVHVVLILVIFEVWPIYGVYPFAAIPIGVICLFTLICLLGRNSYRKTNGLKNGFEILVGTSISLLTICTVIYVLVGLFIAFDGRRTDLGSTEVRGHTYRAVLHEGFWDDDPTYIKLYKCEIFNLVCPLLEGKRAGLNLGYPDTNLKYNTTINKIEVWSNGKMIYTFDKM